MSTAPAPEDLDEIHDEAPPYRPTRDYPWVLLVGGLLGLWASAMLAIDYMNILADPQYVPSCDINPLIGCGQFLGSDAGHAFGIPNVIVGIAAYPVVVVTGALLASGVSLPRWYWRGLLIGTALGVAFVTWLQVQAIGVLGALCPYCLVIWAATIPIFVLTLGESMAVGAIPGSDGLRRFLRSNRWLLVALWCLVVTAVAVLVLWDKWLALL